MSAAAAAARVLALPFALLAFGARLADKFWIAPLTWRIQANHVAVLLGLASMLLSLVLPAGGYLLASRRARRRSAVLQADGGARRFVAVSRLGGPSVVLAGWLAGGLFITERAPGGGARLMEVSTPWLVFSGVTLLLIAVVTVLQLYRPYVALDPDGVTVQRLWNRATIGWPELAPGRPTSGDGDGKILWLYRAAPSTPHAPAPGEKVPVHELQVSETHLAGAIRHYVDHPEHRAAIGAPDELDRLRSELATAGNGRGATSGAR